MRRLDKDIFARRSGTSISGRRPSFPALVLVLLSCGLLVLSRADNAHLKQLRWQMAQGLAPVLAAAAVPLRPVRWAVRQVTERRDLAAENDRLRHENLRLAGWESRARELERRLDSLATLARVVEESAIPFATARVIAEASGPFVRSLIIDAGRLHSLQAGQAVIGAEGMIGRILDTGQQASRVLLVTDRTSRVPVMVGSQEARAILIGDDGPEPRLQFVAPDSTLAIGDEVSTSGVGGVLPRGLRIGRVVAAANGLLRVEPHVRIDRLDYVSVLLTSLPGAQLADEPRPPSTETRLRRAQARPTEESR